MENTIREGNYKKFGVSKGNGGCFFTFEGEKEADCFVRIYDKQNQLIQRIEVPKSYCMGSVRSIFIGGIKERELRYHYEINGEIITDYYADKIIGREVWNHTERSKNAFVVYGGKENQEFDWEEDLFPEVPKSKMVMYKLHIRGFSMDAKIRGRKKGTFAAISDKIEYLKELGITTVEFMPVYEFEELILEKEPELPDYIKVQVREVEEVLEPKEKIKAVGLNYWGYEAGNYFAVKASYASTNNPSREFKELIKKMHQNGLECIMEMFFPSGMNPNIILDVLHFWVREYHVDGFHLLGDSVPIKAVARDVFLSRTKLFYNNFEGKVYHRERKYENLYLYNDEYLYPARMLLNHLGSSIQEFADQQRKQNERLGFVNYIVNNNSFTLMDLFSYQEKHNEENGEKNTDGMTWNFSSNCGIEGKTNKRYVNELRKKQVRNAFAMLFFAQGVPLFLAGDEMGNSQNGNNNAYCQDNQIGWLNWKKDGKNKWLLEFVKQLAAFRKAHPILSLEVPMRLNDHKRKGCPDLSYHGESAWLSGFGKESNAFGTMYCGSYAKKEDGKPDDYLYIGYNFHLGSCKLALPRLPEKRKWYLVMDTSESELPFLEQELCLESQQIFNMKAQSVVALIGK